MGVNPEEFRPKDVNSPADETSLEKLRIPQRPEMFPVGQIVITPSALEILTPAEVLNALSRHSAGDWGDLDQHDLKENERSLESGDRLLSAYPSLRGERFWIITEADRSVTTILLPRDY